MDIKELSSILDYVNSADELNKVNFKYTKPDKIDNPNEKNKMEEIKEKAQTSTNIIKAFADEISKSLSNYKTQNVTKWLKGDGRSLFNYLSVPFKKDDKSISHLCLVFDHYYGKPMYRVALECIFKNVSDFDQHNKMLQKQAPKNMIYWTGTEGIFYEISADNPQNGYNLMKETGIGWIGLGRYLEPNEFKNKTYEEILNWTINTLKELDEFYDLSAGITHVELKEKNKVNTKYFCEVFGRKLLEYKNNRQVLIEKINKIYKQTQEKLISGYSKTGFNKIEKDISPIQALALFMPQTEDIETLQNACKDEFKLDSFYLSNEDFYPFPLVIPFIDKNFIFKYIQFNKLWNLFETAITYYDNPDQENKNKFIYNYNRVRQLINNGNSTGDFKLTRAFYWMFPEFYLSLDSHTRDYLYNKFEPDEIPSFFSIFRTNKQGEFIFNGATLPDGETYLKIIDEIKTLIKCFMLLKKQTYMYLKIQQVNQTVLFKT